MKTKMTSLVGLIVLTTVAALLAAGCSEQNHPTAAQPAASEPDPAALEAEQARGRAENEAIKDRLEPFVQIVAGRFTLLPGAKDVVSPSIVSSVEQHLVELNAMASRGEIVIQSDRAIVQARGPALDQTAACWRGVETNWWGWYIGMSDADVHNVLNAWNDINRMKTVLGWIGVSAPWQINLYFNVLKYNLKVFDCCICRHSCETVTIYYWAMPTPFLNCQ